MLFRSLFKRALFRSQVLNTPVFYLKLAPNFVNVLKAQSVQDLARFDLFLQALHDSKYCHVFHLKQDLP